MSTENLIREALHRQAERAVDPDRVRAGLPARSARRVRRQRFGGLAIAAGAVAVAVVVTVPVVALRGGTGEPLQAGATTPSTSATTPSAPSAPAVIQMPIRYSPTWLPPGFAEHRRDAVLAAEQSPDNAVIRIWTQGQTEGGNGKGARLTVNVQSTTKPSDFAGAGTAVDINGKAGVFHDSPDGSKSYVEWMPDPQTLVYVQQITLGLGMADLVRIARSVQPTPAKLEVALRVAWLPAGLALSGATLAVDSPASWQAQATYTADESDRKRATRIVQVAVGTSTDAPTGGEALTVGGRKARFVGVDGDDSGGAYQSYLVVELGDGRRLTVTAIDLPAPGSAVDRLPRADLVRIAENTTAGEVDLSWTTAR